MEEKEIVQIQEGKEYIDSQIPCVSEEPKEIDNIIEENSELKNDEMSNEEIEKLLDEQVPVSEEDIRQMKWDAELPSKFSKTLVDMLIADEIPEETINTLDKATIKAIEGHQGVNFLSDEEIKNEELYTLITPEIIKAILVEIPEGKTEEELKLIVCKEMISQSFIDTAYFNDPENMSRLQDKIFNKELKENPEALKTIHERIIKLYENPNTHPKFKEALEDDYRIVKQEYRDTLLFITRMGRFAGIIKRMSEKKKQQASIESMRILNFVYNDIKLKQSVQNLVKAVDESFNWFLAYGENTDKNFPININTVKNVPLHIFIALSREKNLLRYNSAAFYDFAIKLVTLITKIFETDEVKAYMEKNNMSKEYILTQEKTPEDFKEVLLDLDDFKYFNNIMMHCMHKFVWDLLPANRKLK